MKYTFSFLIVLFCNVVLGQTARVTGRITDASNNDKLEYATITLRSASDEKLYGGKSKQDGSFEILNVPFGNYLITVSSIGYNSKKLENYLINAAEVNLPVFSLENNSKVLKNVTVVGERPSIEIGIDKKTFNVDKNITSAGGTAADILRNVPSVNVDLDGNLSVRGKEGVTLLVDGKPSAMFGNDVATALQTIPASSIESIEVITNPSSKYEAQGMNGIVNIILKKDRKAGYNGMITLGAAMPFRLNGGLNLNANIGKWNVFMNANVRTSKVWEKTTTSRDNYTDSLTYSSFTRNDRRPLSGFINLGTEYTMNKRNKFTLSQSIFNANMRGDQRTTIDNEIDYSTLLTQQIRTNQYTGKPLNGTTNLQYKHTGKDPKEELNVELNFSKSRYLRESRFESTYYDSNMQYVNSFIQKNPVKGGNWNGTFQIDYTKPLGKNSRLDIGERTYYMEFKSKNDPTIQYAGQNEIPETILQNHYIFTQQVHGVYANLAGQYKKTGVQLGLRGEYFAYEGTVYQYNATAKNSYLSLFPTVFLSQKITPHQDINFNYSRRVNRPNFFQLIPFIDVSNPQDTSVGNPNLKPEFINSAEVTYSNQYNKSDNFLVSVYYQYTNDIIQRYRRFNNNGTTFSQNQNLATGITYGIELTNKINLLSWWDATLNVNVFRNKINGNNIDGVLNRTGFGGFAKLVTNAKLPQGFSVQLTSNYNAKTVVAQGEIAPYGNVDIAVKKNLFKNLMTLTVNANDIFNTIQTETNYNLYPYYNQTVLRKNQTRSVGINLQVRFASKSLRNNAEAQTPKRPGKKDKEKEGGKNRDENLKKDDGGDDNGGGGPGGGNNNGNKNNP